MARRFVRRDARHVRRGDEICRLQSLDGEHDLFEVIARSFVIRNVGARTSPEHFDRRVRTHVRAARIGPIRGRRSVLRRGNFDHVTSANGHGARTRCGDARAREHGTIRRELNGRVRLRSDDRDRARIMRRSGEEPIGHRDDVVMARHRVDRNENRRVVRIRVRAAVIIIARVELIHRHGLGALHVVRAASLFHGAVRRRKR